MTDIRNHEKRDSQIGKVNNNIFETIDNSYQYNIPIPFEAKKNRVGSQIGLPTFI